jgi:putative ABC transport system permease protein
MTSKPPPPAWALRFLRSICPDHLAEEIEGDLIQRFESDVRRLGLSRARRRFEWNAMRYFRPGIVLRNKLTYSLINTIMLRNYLIIAFRNVTKNKVFSLINIFGLGTGLAVCLLIFQFVSHELSFDTFFDNADRIYRVTNDRFQNGKLIQHGTITYPTIGPTMAKDYPEIEMYTRLMPGGDMNVKIDDKIFRGENCHFVDEHFLSVFSFPLLAGDRTSALKEPYALVLTESVAKKYYGVTGGDYTSILGKTLYWGLDKQPYKITGVCADNPDNSHITFDVLVSYATLIRPEEHGADDSWTWSDFRHYVVLKPGIDYKAFESKFPAFSDRYFKGDKVSGSVEKFYLQPLKKAHLYSDYEYDIARTASGKAVWAMLIVAIFILVIAWINYINLTTSRALDRAKEVGLRKVMGALKTQLVRQFIFESILISLIAFVVAVVITWASQSSFNDIVGSPLSMLKVLREMQAPSIVIAIMVLVSGVLLAGFYPAFVLSSYQPATVLKGKFQHSSGGKFMRKALVVFQFTASATLITGTLIVSKQLKFMNEADLGIAIRNIMLVDPPELTAWDSTFMTRVENYKDELTKINGVVSAATSSRIPGNRLGRTFGLRLAEQPSDTHYTMSFFGADHNFMDTYDVPLVAGRKFLPTDHKFNFGAINSVIINQNAVQLLGIANAQEAIGKEILDGDLKVHIVGVVGNFHQESLKKPMEPIVFVPTYSTYAETSIKIKTSDPKPVIAQVEAVFKKFFPNNAFQYSFLEDRYNRQYNDEDRFAKVVTIFTLLGIIISCLGLIGLSSYTAIQRTKEIGIRKALGASRLGIVSLLSADFIKLVAVAIVLSFPLAYMAMEQWLSNYPYKIALQWTLFLLPAVTILVIAFATISFQIFKTAKTNPADTLKYE